MLRYRMGPMDQPTATHRMAYLDGLRGLAALDVVITHFAAIFYPFALFGSDYPRQHAAEALFWLSPLGVVFSGRFAVCLFFVLSGFVLSLRFLGPNAADGSDLRANIIKRVFRLSGLLLATALFGYLLIRADLLFNDEVAAVTGSSPWFSHMWKSQLSGFDFAQLLLFNAFSETDRFNPPLWTIGYELYGSYLTLGLLLFLRNTRMRFVVYGLAAVYLRESFYTCFLLGLLFADLHQNHPRWRDWIRRPAVAGSLLGAGLLLGGCPAYLPPAHLAQSLYGLLPNLDGFGGGYSTVGAALVLLGTLGSPWLHRFLMRPSLAFLGTISFALYSCHMLVQGTFTSWLFLVLIAQLGYDASALLASTASLALMIPIAWLLWRWIDVPAIRLSAWVGAQYRTRIEPMFRAAAT